MVLANSVTLSVKRKGQYPSKTTKHSHLRILNDSCFVLSALQWWPALYICFPVMLLTRLWWLCSYTTKGHLGIRRNEHMVIIVSSGRNILWDIDIPDAWTSPGYNGSTHSLFCTKKNFNIRIPFQCTSLWKAPGIRRKSCQGTEKAESRSVALFVSDWDKQKFSFYADFADWFPRMDFVYWRNTMTTLSALLERCKPSLSTIVEEASRFHENWRLCLFNTFVGHDVQSTSRKWVSRVLWRSKLL